MRRRRDWDARLERWARKQLGRPFVWGSTDCASLVRGVIAALYEGGKKKMSAQPGWTTEQGAIRALKRTGGVDAVLRRLGAEVVPPAFAQRADVVVVDRDPLPATGVVVAAGVLVSTPERGVFMLPRPPKDDTGVTVLRLPHGW